MQGAFRTIVGAWRGLLPESESVVDIKARRVMSEISAAHQNADNTKDSSAPQRRHAEQKMDRRRKRHDVLEVHRALSGDSAARDSRPLTVLHVVPRDQGRGGQVYAGQLRDALADHLTQNHRVVTLFASPDAAACADIKLGARGGVLRRLGLDPVAVWRLRGAIRRHRADLVVAHGGEALKYVVPAAGRVPTVYYKIGLSQAEVTRPLHKHLYRFLARKVTKVVGISHDVSDQVVSLLNVPTNRVTVIPNGRDPERYRPLEPGETSHAPPRVMFVGTLETGKRPELFLDVVSSLQARNLDFSAAIAGDGPLRKALERRAAQLGVEMLGARQDISELLRRSSVLVMTSAAATEGMPGILIEAALSGVPVATTPAAGVADVVASGQTGYIVNGGPRELADVVAGLLGSQEMAKHMGAAARERGLCHFAVATTATQWAALTEELTTSHGIRTDA